jgi:vacuolar-type H+-ATPase subunit H
MELLEKIRQAEGDGEQLVARARQDSEALISSAREEAHALVEGVKDECRAAETRLLAEAESEAGTRCEKKAAENGVAIESLRTSAQQSIEGAVKLIIESVADKS